MPGKGVTVRGKGYGKGSMDKGGKAPAKPASKYAEYMGKGKSYGKSGRGKMGY